MNSNYLQPTTYNLQPNLGFPGTLISALFRFCKKSLSESGVPAKALSTLSFRGETKKATPNLASGFVALFAVLVSSIVLTISFGLLNIAIKESILASSGRESQFGFYAADAGTECALYWDVKGLGGTFVSVFPTSTGSVVPGQGSGIICNSQDLTAPHDAFTAWDTSNRSASSATTTFWLSIVSGKACAKVDVAKSANSTKIESYGYNICNFNSPRVIERAIRITY